MSISEKFHRKKIPTSQKLLYLLAHYQLQKKTMGPKDNRAENGRRKELKVRAKEESSHAGEHTSVWSSSSRVTVAWTFATMSWHCPCGIMQYRL